MKDLEIARMMRTMKQEGKSDREVGYAVTKGIYGEPDTSELDVRVFLMVTQELLEHNPDDEFILGSIDFINENFELSTMQ